MASGPQGSRCFVADGVLPSAYDPGVQDQRLIGSQRNDVLAAITQHGLEPSSFRWADVESGDDFNGFRLVSRVTHTPTGYYAQFDYLDSHGLPYFEFSPGRGVRAERYTPDSPLFTWHQHILEVGAWVARLKVEIDAPDLWAWIDQPQLLSAPDAERDTFTAEQVVQLKAQVEEARQLLLAEHADSDAQRETINDRLDYLVAATETQGRRDWYFLALGVIVQLAVQLAMTPSLTSRVWQILVHGLPPLLGG